MNLLSGINTNLPPYIFKKTRVMMSLLASLFLFDSFPQYSLSKIMEYCGKRSNPVDGSCRKYNLLSIFESQSILFLNFVGKCIFTRMQSIWKAEPLGLQIFRGLPFNETTSFKGLSFCEIDRSFSVLRHRPRCRSPPLLKSGFNKILGNGGLPYGNEIFQKERPSD